MGGTNPGDATTAQYDKPSEGRDNGMWGSMFGTPYANEKDPSWEDVIAMVVIPGNPAAVRQASGEWRALLSRLQEVERVLNAVVKDLEHWKGAGGDEYRKHLTDMITKVKTLHEDNKNIPHYLDQAAEQLQTAIDKIPIPDDMVHEVMAAKNGYIANGKVAGPFGPGAIYDTLLPVYGNKWLDEIGEFFTWDWAAHKLRDWISDQDDIAKAAYHTLADQHSNTMSHMPGSNPVDFTNPRNPTTEFEPTKVGSNPSGMPKMGSNPGNPNLHNPTTNPHLNNPNLDNPTTDPNLTDTTGEPPGIGNTDLPGSGLAGAGGGLSGVGSGGGLGSGLGGLGPAGGGLGAGGLGSGGLGSGGLRGGAGGGIGGMMPGMGGVGAGAGRGRGVAGAGSGKGGVGGARGGKGGVGGARGGMAGMAPGAHGAGGEGEDHSTWLEEDEDVWGSDTEAPPSVLG